MRPVSSETSSSDKPSEGGESRNRYRQHHYSSQRPNSDSYQRRSRHSPSNMNVNYYNINPRNYIRPTYNHYGSSSQNYYPDNRRYESSYNDRRSYSTEYNYNYRPERDNRTYDDNRGYETTNRRRYYDYQTNNSENDFQYRREYREDGTDMTVNTQSPSSAVAAGSVIEQRQHSSVHTPTSTSNPPNASTDNQATTTERTSSQFPPKKKKRKRKMSERRKQMHRDRAAKHQQELKMKAITAGNSVSELNSGSPSIQNESSGSLLNANDNVTTEPNATSIVLANETTGSTNDSQLCHSTTNRGINSSLGYTENNIISSWTTGFNTVEENIIWTRPLKVSSSRVSPSSWKSSSLMVKFRNRQFSDDKQRILDTKYKYYNPFVSVVDSKTFGGWDHSTSGNSSFESVAALRTCNDTYKNLTKYWKAPFLASIEEELTSFRLVWTSSISWHYAGLKIFSLLENSIQDIMYVIGECLVGRSVYVTMSDIKDKAQYDSDYIDRDKSVITNLQSLWRKFDSSSYLEYRFFCTFIQQYYMKRVKDCVKNGFLMSAGDLAQFCFAEKCNNIVRYRYGTDMQFFEYRQKAMLETFKYIDISIDKYPLDSDSEPEYDPDSPWFSDDEKIKVRGMHRDGLKEMLFMLQFTGFESTLKCPCSKVYYSDLLFLYGCPLPEDHCKNQVFRDITSLYQHFDNKGCIFHSVLSNYLVNLSKFSGIGDISSKKRRKRSRK